MHGLPTSPGLQNTDGAPVATEPEPDEEVAVVVRAKAVEDLLRELLDQARETHLLLLERLR